QRQCRSRRTDGEGLRRHRGGSGVKSTTIDKFTGVAMAAPMVLGIGAFGLVPFLMVVWYSLHEWNPLAGTFDFSGVANYLRMFTDPQIPTSVGATLGFAGLLMVLNIPLA